MRTELVSAVSSLPEVYASCFADCFGESRMEVFRLPVVIEPYDVELTELAECIRFTPLDFEGLGCVCHIIEFEHKLALVLFRRGDIAEERDVEVVFGWKRRSDFGRSAEKVDDEIAIHVSILSLYLYDKLYTLEIPQSNRNIYLTSRNERTKL